MTTRRRAITARWTSVLSLSIVGSCASKLILIFAEPALERGTENFAAVGMPWLIGFITILVTSVLVPLSVARPSGFLGLRYFFVYPPLWLAILLAFALLLCLEYWCRGWPAAACNENRFDDLTPLILLGCILVAFILALAAAFAMAAGNRRVRGIEPRTVHTHSMNEKGLFRWLDADDAPISLPSQDMFEHRQVAARMARRLTERIGGMPAAPTFVVFGPRGIGKTSLFNLLEHYLDTDEKRAARATQSVNTCCVRVSAWKYSDSDSLLRGVLSTVITHVHRLVDAHSLTGLPASYVATISATGGVLGSLASIFSPIHHDPEVAVERITQVLMAIDVLMVVWLDDLERFGGDREAPEPVRALLALFRGSRYITFVLALSQELP